MESFTPVSGLIGGALIGLAATLLLALNGRIAGISGILGGLFMVRGSDWGWRAAFLIGLVAGPLLVWAVTSTPPEVEPQAATPLLILAGLLVGLGTAIGKGCTSGHGVCGLARGSRRSIAATAVFFTVALATVAVTRHLIGA